MDQSSMSREQLEQRASVVELLVDAGWQLNNVEAFEHDLWLNAEVTGRKRVPTCIMELNYSVEDAYVSFAAAQFHEGRAEYVIYVDSFETAVEVIQTLLVAADQMTVAGAAQLSQQLAAAYPGEVFFFTGSEKIELNATNALDVFHKFNSEVA
ncbi:hypothetical protein [Deinococcus puniceus]|uniref:Uncharacterized protein n=1 Tax=Deinococcus puniceus TaxID=1182568 RepID=A0A172T780_9DEIO|nr:hypothetical protein [Deinococcus puniceus]ANE42673.1 hypothetical protein SU48_01660 [Deinococcus puniceus]